MAERWVSQMGHLLEQACRAPSGDNTQPWAFAIDADTGRVAFRVDESRDPSPMNAGQRMARIAVGATLENLNQVATGLGWGVEFEAATPPDLAVVRLTPGSPGGGKPDGTITARATNRRIYDRGVVPADVLDGLRNDAPTFERIEAHWVVERDRIGALADLIGRADALMFGEPTMRLAFLAKVRFDAPADEAVREGLSLGSLEVSGADRVALRAMRHTPDWVLRAAGAGRVFAAKARGLVNSASGLCLVVAPDGSAATDVNVGRAMQRAWLALTRRGFAAQPMMSLMVLENAVEQGHPVATRTAYRRRIADLSRGFRDLLPEIGARRPAFLLRFGHAAAPSGRTGRLPISDIIAGPAAAGAGAANRPA